MSSVARTTAHEEQRTAPEQAQLCGLDLAFPEIPQEHQNRFHIYSVDSAFIPALSRKSSTTCR
jgi:hypothetical protein